MIRYLPPAALVAAALSAVLGLGLAWLLRPELPRSFARLASTPPFPSGGAPAGGNGVTTREFEQRLAELGTQVSLVLDAPTGVVEDLVDVNRRATSLESLIQEDPTRVVQLSLIDNDIRNIQKDLARLRSDAEVIWRH